MSDLTRILYTAEATAEGGRDGRARTNDGRLEVELDVPAEMGGSGGAGTNPEQLFAAGWAACFQTVLIAIASGRKLDLTGSRVTARLASARSPAEGSGSPLPSISTHPESAARRASS